MFNDKCLMRLDSAIALFLLFFLTENTEIEHGLFTIEKNRKMQGFLCVPLCIALRALWLKRRLIIHTHYRVVSHR